MDIATSGVADDGRIFEEEEARTSLTPAAAQPPVGETPVDASPVESPAAALVWLNELQVEGTRREPAAHAPTSSSADEHVEAASHSDGRAESPFAAHDGTAAVPGTPDAASWMPASQPTASNVAPGDDGTSPRDRSEPADDASSTDMRTQAIVLRLEDVARRIRTGELRPPGGSETPSDAGALAAALAMLLDDSR